MLRIGIILAVINIFFLFKAWQASGLIIIPFFSAIVFSFICLFFRVPERKCIKNENLIYAPADGTVAAVEAEIAHTDAYKKCKWYPICPLRIFYELACKVPMKSAVAIAGTLVAVSTLSGFIGHAVAGHFDYRIAIPLAIGGAIGGLIGGSIAIKTKPKLLKILFALTILTAAVMMAYKVFN